MKTVASILLLVATCGLIALGHYQLDKRLTALEWHTGRIERAIGVGQ